MSDYVPKVTNEMWLAKKVYGDRPIEAIPRWMAFFQGVTTLSQRRQRMRETIALLDMGEKMVNGKDTFAAAFERLYHEPLYLPHTDVDWIQEIREEGES